MAKKQLMAGEETLIISEKALRKKIYIIRGQRVMLDYDLAEIYGYTTSAFNQQVKNNIDKFEGEDFMFRLAEDDIRTLSMSKNLISIQIKGMKGGRAKMPYAFTEQGIYMLMTVLRGELATKQSRALIRMFKAMKDYILENQEQLDYKNNLLLVTEIADNKKDLELVKREIEEIDSGIVKINKEMDEMVRRSEISPILLDFRKEQERGGFVFTNGELVKASELYTDIYSSAKKNILIIDNYISIKTLRHLQNVKPGVEIIIFSDNLGRNLHKVDYEDFKKDRRDLNIQFIKTGGMIHDRFIVIDYGYKNEMIYHAGASEKDAGKKLTMVAKFDDELVKKALADVIEKLKRNEELVLK